MLAHDSKPSMLLQQPGQMGPLRLKNRVVMGPMVTNFGTTDGFSTERDKIYYAKRDVKVAKDLRREFIRRYCFAALSRLTKRNMRLRR